MKDFEYIYNRNLVGKYFVLSKEYISEDFKMVYKFLPIKNRDTANIEYEFNGSIETNCNEYKLHYVFKLIREKKWIILKRDLIIEKK
jgi:hypothetical protein